MEVQKPEPFKIFSGKAREAQYTSPNWHKLLPPDELPTCKLFPKGKKGAKIQKVFEILWMRCMVKEHGDCKMKTSVLAEEVGVCEGTIFRYLDWLEDKGFIARCIRTGYDYQKGKHFSVRYFRVFAAWYHLHYQFTERTHTLWRNDYRPPIDKEQIKRDILLKFKISKPTLMKFKNGTTQMMYPIGYDHDRKLSLGRLHMEIESANPETEYVSSEAWEKLHELTAFQSNSSEIPQAAHAKKILGYTAHTYAIQTGRTLSAEARKRKKIEKLAQINQQNQELNEYERENGLPETVRVRYPYIDWHAEYQAMNPLPIRINDLWAANNVLDRST